ncbi:MAG: methyltransferase domain-containing protein [Nitriliruptorales bacterium]|nr:methyltransferase domain-containing protein [Nitriliruptorales bacterium]
MWDPDVYLRHADHRLRPGVELLARVVVSGDVRTVVDLGCGTGVLVPMLRDRFRNAEVIGVDSSPEMLAAARRDLPDGSWVEADVSSWRPDGPVDVVYSNALLQWVDDHETLFPRLLSWLRPGGVLAVQMPRNFGSPSHVAVHELARDPRWADRLEPGIRPAPVADPDWYLRLLAPLAGVLDVWEVVYQQLLDGEDPVVSWSSGTLLRPLLAELDEDEQDSFLAAYAERMRAAYPPLPDGRTPFPFRRLFIVATAA